MQQEEYNRERTTKSLPQPLSQPVATVVFLHQIKEITEGLVSLLLQSFLKTLLRRTLLASFGVARCEG